ncbi:protein kinase, putative [Entamoeba histolytica HM-1:IMSS-B]|uniref:Protein kinase, putative n=1 Tax=Entamoeba histolytica HM-1:IMSS-B TaxID=885319 RepID=M3TEQ9_ENTH1|nr:protein kinase, putative [Entamoeba histolytica HM-1:IMSS-B]
MVIVFFIICFVLSVQSHINEDFIILVHVDGYLSMHESKNGELMWLSQQLDPFIKTNSEEILLPSIDSSHSLFEFDSLTGEFKKFSYSINDIFDNSPFVLYNKEYITYRFIHQYGFDLNSGMICKDNCSSYLGIKDMLPFVVTQYQISSVERDGLAFVL